MTIPLLVQGTACIDYVDTVLSTVSVSGAAMKAIVRKWGNSASVRIPAAVMTAAGLNLDQPVDVREENGRIVIEPIRRALDIAALIDAITDDNRHAETDMGAPVGREVW